MTEPRMPIRGGWRILILVVPAALVLLFAFGLTRDPSVLPSATKGTPAPAFELPALEGDGVVRLADHRGKVVMVNFWASWCVSCRVEHDVLIALGEAMAGRDDVVALGINYRDEPENALAYLAQHGAYPYPSGVDPKGRLGIDFGVYGLPETYFLDRNGLIRERHIGPIDMPTARRYLTELGVQL